jgi:hypothetical protein
MQLFARSGMTAIINDDLAETALNLVALVVGALTAVVGYLYAMIAGVKGNWVTLLVILGEWVEAWRLSYEGGGGPADRAIPVTDAHRACSVMRRILRRLRGRLGCDVGAGRWCRHHLRVLRGGPGCVPEDKPAAV